MLLVSFFFFKQKTAYEMRISDWSSDVCSSDLVDSLHPCGNKCFGMAFKLASVGGERQFVQVACLQMPPKAAHQIVDTAPDERLAPCQPQATDAPSYEGGGDAVDLLQAQHLGARHESHRLATALTAAKIAAGRHLNADRPNR